MTTMLQSSYLFVVSLLLAWLEVQIEGPEGWAKNLPTWRDQPRWARAGNPFFWLARSIFSWATGGNRLTGYHAALLSFLFATIELPLVLTTPSWSLFGVCTGYFFIMTVVWDFLWFVINPAFGMQRFGPKHIAWHPRWLGPMPAPYLGGLLLGGLLIAAGSGDISESWKLGAAALLIQGLLTALAVLVSERIRRNAVAERSHP